MSRALGAMLALLAMIAGAFVGECFSRALVVHRLASRLFGRGELLAMVGRRGIFQADARALGAEKEWRAPAASVDEAALRAELIANEALRISAAGCDTPDLERVVFALRAEFGSERAFGVALRASGISERQLRQMSAESIRGEQWIEQKLAGQLNVFPADAQRYFDAHRAEFTQPLRLRVRHIFMAAPQGSPTELTEAKLRAVQEIVARLNRGEDFAALAEVVSEDEATKARGGDLGFVAANRVPAEFWNAIVALQVKAPVALLQSHLGFHALQILEVRPVRAMSFEEARPEIEQLLAAQKRRQAVTEIQQRLALTASWVSK